MKIKARKLTLLLILLWAIVVLWVNVPLVFLEEPVDDKQRAKEYIEHVLFDTESERVNLKTKEVRLLSDYAVDYYLRDWHSRLWHIASGLIIIGLISFSLYRNRKDK